MEFRSVVNRLKAPRPNSKVPLCLLPIIAESNLNTTQYPIKAARKNNCSAIALPNILILKIDTQKEIFVFTMDQDVTKEYGFQYKAETGGGGDPLNPALTHRGIRELGFATQHRASAKKK